MTARCRSSFQSLAPVGRSLPYTNPVLRLHPVLRLPLALVGLLLPVATSPSVAQQREPRVEIYGLSGVYSPGISWAPFTPQAGAGVLLPLGSKWAALVDVGASITQVDVYSRFLNVPGTQVHVFYQRNPHLTNEDEHFARAVTIRPAVVRIWRQDRLSFWVGAGFGYEWERNRVRARHIHPVYDENGEPLYKNEDDDFPVLVRDETFDAHDSWARRAMLIGNFGVSVDLTPRVVFRLGYSCLMGDPDSSLAGAVEMGIGYRF